MVRLGFIGCGSMSRSHVMRLSFLEPGEVEIVGLCDVNLGNAQRLMKTVNRFRNLSPKPLTECSLYTDYTKMFDELDLEAVIVCTPHVFHYKHVMAALDRGLHALVEKPMALDINQAEKMRDKAEENNVIMLYWLLGIRGIFDPSTSMQERSLEAAR